MPHFHIPLQSGSNELLGLMRRRYKRELYQDRVEKIKKEMPDACMGVDVIVGFPGETEELFEETYTFLNELDISYLHVFTYSERENTLAVDMPGKIPLKVRHQRSQRLRNLSEMKRRHFYDQFIGTKRNVLLEDAEKEGHMFGYTDNYVKVAIPFQDSLGNQLIELSLDAFTPKGWVEGSLIHAPEGHYL